MLRPDEAAFPVPGDGPGATDGLTKREFLAGLALQGLCASRVVEIKGAADLGKAAVAAADALIKELNR